LFKVIVAYEPVWAIGTNKPCKIDDVLTVSIFIRKMFSTLFGFKKPELIKILYGGSVNSENAKKYVEEARVDGLLVGGKSLDGEEFLRIVSSFY
ncbi:MAG: triose-phosphate isomerase, partial [Candidatus Pacebacteria bacterium]|nr:triose-phosphate isomerase [Candidatus Paceibacterota bacterium]